jgi:hypothetical protein
MGGVPSEIDLMPQENLGFVPIWDAMPFHSLEVIGGRILLVLAEYIREIWVVRVERAFKPASKPVISALGPAFSRRHMPPAEAGSELKRLGRTRT